MLLTRTHCLARDSVTAPGLGGRRGGRGVGELGEGKEGRRVTVSGCDVATLEVGS